ncbi:MAG: metallophosphoesterase, partial [Candidatus Abyssubacteria bacterium]|nr:metallophosphoesterase [Candidatus Abyssubacteria bacterium]
MNRFRKSILIVPAILCAITVLLGCAGLWIGSRAQDTAELMKSHEWINNDRCLARVAESSDQGPDFKFAVFGDVQIGSAQLPRLIEALEKESQVAFVVQTGDAVAHADEGHYKVFLNALARSGLRLPMFVLPGNHDVDDGGGELFEEYFGPRQLW